MSALEDRTYCGPFGMEFTKLFGSESTSWRERRFDASAFYTHRARVAIRQACEVLGVGRGDEILAPSYNCGSEIDALSSSGATVKLYNINKNLTVDCENLKGLINRKVRIIYIIHYFGFPQDVEMIRDVCSKNGIYLVEDCALSLLSCMADGSPIGSTADIALYNFPKTVPVPDGGALVIHGSNIFMSDVQWKNPPGLKILREILPFVKRGVLRGASGTVAFPIVWQILRKSYRSNSLHEKYPEMPRHYYYDERLNAATMSSVTKWLLPKIDVERIIKLRRKNYQLYLDELRSMKRIEILHDNLDDGTCPLSFPLLIDRRYEVCRKMAACSIDAMEWWSGYHSHLPWKEFRDACYLKDHLLTLPVHQQLDEGNVKYICEKMKKAMDEVFP